MEALFILQRMIKEAHEPMRFWIEWNLSIPNSLVVFYSNQKTPSKAIWLFELMPKRDVVSHYDNAKVIESLIGV